MSEFFNLKVLTPENVYVDSKISSLIVPGKEGYLGIQNKHVELITILKSGLVSFKKEDETWQHVVIGTGCLSVSIDRCLMFLENVYSLETLNEKDILEEINQLQSTIKNDSNLLLEKEVSNKIESLKNILETLKLLEVRKIVLNN